MSEAQSQKKLAPRPRQAPLKAVFLSDVTIAEMAGNLTPAPSERRARPARSNRRK